jgi:hypothetical protein
MTNNELDEVAIAYDREESDSCQAGTIGCCIDHDGVKHSCETW